MPVASGARRSREPRRHRGLCAAEEEKRYDSAATAPEGVAIASVDNAAGGVETEKQF